MNLSKSKFCKGFQCPKILWMDKNMPEKAEEADNSSVLENGTEVGELAKGLMGKHIDIEFNENLQIMLDDTQNAIQSYDKIVITEASFNYNNNFCSVDLLRKNGDEYDIIEVKSSTSLHEIYKMDASYQYYILTRLGLNVKKVYVAILNKDYVRGKELEIDKLFSLQDVTDIAIHNYSQMDEMIKNIIVGATSKEEQNVIIGEQCFKPYECAYFNYCSKLKRPNVFDLRRVSFTKKLELFNKGLIYYEDLMKSNLKDTLKLQIDYYLNNKEDYIKYENIEKFLNELTVPLYFLDFETFQESIPPYEGLKPYSQIPFQYSLHYYDEGHNLNHKEFLAQDGVDPRRSLAESLVRDIPTDVCVLAYNMSFEKSVIKALAECYPDLSEKLMNIHDNIKDLMIPFFKYDYYTKDFQGSYSIKYVLPALFPNDESLNYHNLELIHNGSEAMKSFANLSKMNPEEKKIVRENLLKYCKLDTYAMVKIYDKLQETVKQRKK